MNNNKKTLVIGASPKPERYAYKAVSLLNNYNFPVIALGIRNGYIKDIEIIKEKLTYNDIHTVSLYVGADRQKEYYEYIISLKPKRIIFNPGTENNELQQLAQENNIETVEHCTLVMLNSGIF